MQPHIYLDESMDSKNKLYEISWTTNATNVYKCWIRSDTVYHHLPTKNNLQTHSSFKPPFFQHHHQHPPNFHPIHRDACFWSSFLGSHVASPSAIVARHFPMERCSAHCTDAPDSAESHGAHVATSYEPQLVGTIIGWWIATPEKNV